MLLRQADALEKIQNYSGALPECFIIGDHLGGFDQDLHNPVLAQVAELAERYQQRVSVVLNYVANHDIRARYPTLDFKFMTYPALDLLSQYRVHPDLCFENFICSFNGSPHVGRKLLVSVLNRMGWFDRRFCSKNFEYTTDVIDGHLEDFLTPQQMRVYRKFFIGSSTGDFFATRSGFGHVRFEHDKNIYNLEQLITRSFLHLVSETMSTSYYPLVTEKFLYSVTTRGLYVSSSHPGWHQHLEQYWGFRKFDKIFNYSFDAIQNPVERLVELVSMLSKFSILSADDWQDLYDLEKDTIEHNYDHYFSRQYLKQLAKTQEIYV